MAENIFKCKQCKPEDSDCAYCGKQGYFRVSRCGLACEEYGHGSTGCNMYVTDNELKDHLILEALKRQE